jgi:poly-gamma-glutamate synthesis protein (capsule biosynthesis protein)
VRRLLALLAVLAVGALLGAATTVALEEADSGSGAGEGTATLQPTAGTITVALAGEVRAGDALAARLGAPPDDLVGPYGEVLEAAGLAVVDLSAPVIDGQPTTGSGGASWVPAAALSEMEAAGVDVASLANDRALDHGGEGLYATLGAAEGHRLSVAGIGANEGEAYAPVRRRVGGRTIAVLAAAQHLEPARIATDTATAETAGVASAKRVDRLVRAVEEASADADVVVVYVHWGEEGQSCPSAGQQELAAALVDAGADVVAGTGAGSVQGAGRMGDAVVAYGLGALVADGATEAGVLQVEIGEIGVTGWEWVPGRVADGVAQPLAPAEVPAVAADLAARRACAGLTD